MIFFFISQEQNSTRFDIFQLCNQIETEQQDLNFENDQKTEVDEEVRGNTPYEALEHFLRSKENLDISLTVNKKDLIIKILKHALRYKCSKSEIVSLMQLLNDVLQITVLPNTEYLINKLFNPSVDVRCHALCNKCQAYIGTFEKGQRSIVYSKCNTNVSLMDEKSGTYFVTFDIRNDVKSLLKKYGSYYKYVVEERKHTPNLIKEFFDGILFREFVKQLLDDEKHRYLTFTFNSDGAPTFEKSTASIWPVYLQLMELPEDVRSRSILLSGLWFGKSKPCMKSFLVLFVKEMNELSESGIVCNTEGEERCIKPYVLCCVVDSVARAPMQCLH